MKIPWSKFFLGSRGRIQDKQSLVPLEAGVVGMSISLMDGNTGPFHFEIKDIGLHNDPTNDDEQFAYEMYKLPDFWAGYWSLPSVYIHTWINNRTITCWIMKNFRGNGIYNIMGGELNYRQQVLDEICLEGLSGITLQVKSPVETFWGAFITKDINIWSMSIALAPFFLKERPKKSSIAW